MNRVMDRPQGGQAFKRKPQKTEQLDEASEGAFAWMPGPGFTARPKGRLDLWGSDLFNSGTGGSYTRSAPFSREDRACL